MSGLRHLKHYPGCVDKLIARDRTIEGPVRLGSQKLVIGVSMSQGFFYSRNPRFVQYHLQGLYSISSFSLDRSHTPQLMHRPNTLLSNQHAHPDLSQSPHAIPSCPPPTSLIVDLKRKSVVSRPSAPVPALGIFFHFANYTNL